MGWVEDDFRNYAEKAAAKAKNEKNGNLLFRLGNAKQADNFLLIQGELVQFL